MHDHSDSPVCAVTYLIHLLLQFGFGFGHSVHFVLLRLQIIQCLLMSLLQGFLLLRQFADILILAHDFFSQVFHLKPLNAELMLQFLLKYEK